MYGNFRQLKKQRGRQTVTPMRGSGGTRKPSGADITSAPAIQAVLSKKISQPAIAMEKNTKPFNSRTSPKGTAEQPLYMKRFKMKNRRRSAF